MSIHSRDTFNTWIVRDNSDHKIREVPVEEYEDYKFWYIEAYNTLRENGWTKQKKYWLSPNGHMRISDTQEALRVCYVLKKGREDT